MTRPRTGSMPRAVAALAVDAVISGGRNLDRALENAGIDTLDERDRPLASALAYGAVRNHLSNQRIIDSLTDRPFRKRDHIIVALISVGLYALTESRRPDYAVVSATVDAATRLKRPQLKGVVNALLRRFLREREALLTAAESSPESQWLHPTWLIDAIRDDWPDDWEQILTAANTQAPMWLRVNLNRTTRADWLARLASVGAHAAERVPSAVCLPEPVPVSELPGFAAGDCSVQDVASQAAALLLDPQPGMRVLDACAAPGGKAGHLLEYCPQLAELVALDESASRLQRLEENMLRLQLSCSVKVGDAATPEDWWDGTQFDRILLDAPCSATGVIRRHPDIRFLRQPEDVARLAALQSNLLRALWNLLKPGGWLLYSTCSLLRAENEAVVADFLRTIGDADERPLPSGLPGATTDTGHGVQLLPGRDDNDGFYYALMQRRAAEPEKTEVRD
jgi:16S rRNA (cytosine967-C5)-methyltransferase